MSSLRMDLKKDLAEFKMDLTVTVKQKIEQMDHYQRQELSELKSHVIHSSSQGLTFWCLTFYKKLNLLSVSIRIIN